MFKFSEQVKDILCEAGWFDERKIDVTQFKNSLEHEGYIFFPCVETFLSQFGDLHVSFYRKTREKDFFHFDAKKAVEDVFSYWIQENYKVRLNNKNLCVLGQAYSNHLTLMMDENGHVYGGFDNTLVFIANSGEEAIESICLDQKGQQIS